MMTSMVSAMILFDRKTGMTEEEAVKRTQWLYHEI